MRVGGVGGVRVSRRGIWALHSHFEARGEGQEGYPPPVVMKRVRKWLMARELLRGRGKKEWGSYGKERG